MKLGYFLVYSKETKPRFMEKSLIENLYEIYFKRYLKNIFLILTSKNI